MKLSISMLAWYLRDYFPVVSIQDDDLTIEGVRLLFDEKIRRESRYVYYLRADKVLSDAGHEGSLMIVHNRSTMLFRKCDSNELMNRLLSAFDYFNAWEGRLMEAAFAHRPLQQILAIGAEVLTNPCFAGSLGSAVWAQCNVTGQETDPYWEYAAENRSAHPAVYTSPYRDLGRHLIPELSETPTLVENVYEGGAPVMMSYIKEDEGYVGCLSILQKDPSLTEMNRQLSPVLNRYLGNASEFTDPDGALRPAEGILSDLLSGAAVTEENAERLSAFLPPPPFYCLMTRNVVRTDEISRQSFRSMAKQNPLFHLPVIRSDAVIMFVRESVYRNPDVYLSGKEYRNIAAGFSLLLNSVSDLRRGFLQASFVLEQAEEKPGVYFCRDYALSYLLKELRHNEMTEYLLHPAVGILRRYDEDTGSEFLRTITVYLACFRNLTRAAEILSIHINTLKYRLRRITEMTGVDFEAGEQVRYLQLSLWLSE